MQPRMPSVFDDAVARQRVVKFLRMSARPAAAAAMSKAQIRST